MALACCCAKEADTATLVVPKNGVFDETMRSRAAASDGGSECGLGSPQIDNDARLVPLWDQSAQAVDPLGPSPGQSRFGVAFRDFLGRDVKPSASTAEPRSPLHGTFGGSSASTSPEPRATWEGQFAPAMSPMSDVSGEIAFPRFPPAPPRSLGVAVRRDSYKAGHGDSYKAGHGDSYKAGEVKVLDVLMCTVLETEIVERNELKAMVWTFTNRVLDGMKVRTIDRDSGDIMFALIFMTKQLDTLEVRPQIGHGKIYRMIDVRVLETGSDFSNSAPKLAHLERHCVGIRANLDLLFFYFEDLKERDRFLCCMKILRMSLEA